MEERFINYNGRVKIPDEITDIKDKIVFGMTGRQILFSSIALVCSGIAMYLLYSFTSIRGTGWILLSAVFAAPALAFGFAEPAGLPLEDWLTIWWSNNMKSAPVRKLMAENAYEKALTNAPASVNCNAVAIQSDFDSPPEDEKKGKKNKKKKKDHPASGGKKNKKKGPKAKSAYVLKK